MRRAFSLAIPLSSPHLPTHRSPPLHLLPRKLTRTLSSEVSHLNPLLGVNVAAKYPEIRDPSSSARPRNIARAHFRQLPVSPKKLRVVANLVPGLFVREAMLQLEFCQKNIAIFVKNAVDNAVLNARNRGLDPNLLIVDTVSVGQGSHYKRIDFKSKGRSGVKRSYKAHLLVVVKQVTPQQLEQTKFYSRWQRASAILEVPWEERVKQLPKYQMVPGYEPGIRRIPKLPLIPKVEANEAVEGEEAPGASDAVPDASK